MLRHGRPANRPREVRGLLVQGGQGHRQARRVQVHAATCAEQGSRISEESYSFVDPLCSHMQYGIRFRLTCDCNNQHPCQFIKLDISSCSELCEGYELVVERNRVVVLMRKEIVGHQEEVVRNYYQSVQTCYELIVAARNSRQISR